MLATKLLVPQPLLPCRACGSAGRKHPYIQDRQFSALDHHLGAEADDDVKGTAMELSVAGSFLLKPRFKYCRGGEERFGCVCDMPGGGGRRALWISRAPHGMNVCMSAEDMQVKRSGCWEGQAGCRLLAGSNHDSPPPRCRCCRKWPAGLTAPPPAWRLC